MAHPTEDDDTMDGDMLDDMLAELNQPQNDRRGSNLKSLLQQESMDLPQESYGENQLCRACSTELGATKKLRKILLAVDEQEYSHAAFDYYLEYIAQKNDEMTLLHMFDAPAPPSQSSKQTKQDKKIYGDAWKLWKAKIENSLMGVRQIMKEFQDRCRERGVKCDIICKAGSPGEGILDVMKKDKTYTMVIMGTRGLGAFKRRIYGSTSEYVTLKSDVPVVIVPFTNALKNVSKCVNPF